METGRGGMGSRKHGRSGHATPSPRFRLLRKLEAEPAEPARRPPMRSSLAALFRRR